MDEDVEHGRGYGNIEHGNIETWKF
jgi:hypothetical protein